MKCAPSIHEFHLKEKQVSASQLVSTSVGDILGKMAKNCMKILKSTFFGQNREGGVPHDKPIFRLVGDPPVPFPPPGETLKVI